MIKIGDYNYNINGTKFVVIEYINFNKIKIQFQDNFKYEKYTTGSYFLKGGIRNPYDKTVYNVGYLGKSVYEPYDHTLKRNTLCYEYWIKMLQRCYDEKYYKKKTTYINKNVCEEWHNFQNFANWFYKNYYSIEDERMELDKDILHKGNKTYSSENCIFVPKRVNTLFVKNDSDRGLYPIGVNKNNRTGKFISRCNTYNFKINKQVRVSLGYFDTPEEAFYAYKTFKEKYIKQVADYYKSKYKNFPKRLYDAMYNYKVEITD